MITVLYPLALYLGLPALAGLGYYRWRYYKNPVYSYSSLEPLNKLAKDSWLHSMIPYLLRLLTVLCLCLAIARLRAPDERTLIPVQGIDIMLILDASGSMRLVDDIEVQDDRLTIAKREAIDFIKRRTHDPIGLVVFAEAAVTRSPLTLDKTLLEKILKDVAYSQQGGTVLSRGILVGANRLKRSKAKSRIMIVLTDGEPTYAIDEPPHEAIAVAKKLGIKIYTIGIGSDTAYFPDGFGGYHRWPSQSYDQRLLHQIAIQTGGQFFEARSAKDMKKIYETIDQLERSEQQLPVYSQYYEFFIYFLWAALLLLLAEFALTTIFWVRL
jgi:Ca-activated chloride channel family protein